MSAEQAEQLERTSDGAHDMFSSGRIAAISKCLGEVVVEQTDYRQIKRLTRTRFRGTYLSANWRHSRLR
jgi:hypothetical protein